MQAREDEKVALNLEIKENTSNPDEIQVANMALQETSLLQLRGLSMNLCSFTLTCVSSNVPFRSFSACSVDLLAVLSIHDIQVRICV
jgi:hypothetical protein